MSAGCLAASRGSSVWAVTSFFNPAGYRRRLENYRLFRERLAAPLLTVEMSTGGDFSLADDDADIVIRCEDGDVMWQKERLLNHAFARLPAHCRYVAWIDCDVLFTSDAWITELPHRLEHRMLVQLFSEVAHATSDATFEAVRPSADWMRQPSLAKALEEGAPFDECVRGLMRREAGTLASGMAWAARREFVDTYGLFDRSIIGGGDTALLCAVTGRPDLAIDLHHMNASQQQVYRRWAARFTNGQPASVGYVPGVIVHLWHGDLRDRRLSERHRQLAPYDFDPTRDIVVGERGAWKWATDKPALHAYLRHYFGSRLEDGRTHAS
jgi:hypothetical protein